MGGDAIVFWLAIHGNLGAFAYPYGALLFFYPFFSGEWSTSLLLWTILQIASIAYIAHRNPFSGTIFAPTILSIFWGSTTLPIYAASQVLGGFGAAILMMKPQVAAIILPRILIDKFKEKDWTFFSLFFFWSAVIWVGPFIVLPGEMNAWWSTVLTTGARNQFVGVSAFHSSLIPFAFLILSSIVSLKSRILAFIINPYMMPYDLVIFAGDVTPTIALISWALFLIAGPTANGSNLVLVLIPMWLLIRKYRSTMFTS